MGKPVPGRRVNFCFENGWTGSVVNENSPPGTTLVNCACWREGENLEPGPSHASDDQAIEWLYQVSQRPKDDVDAGS